MARVISPQSEAGYLDRKISSVVREPEDLRLVYIADGPMAGEAFDLMFSITDIDHCFFDGRGIHQVSYRLQEYHIPLFQGTILNIHLVWDLMYCARELDETDIGWVSPRVCRIDLPCPPSDCPRQVQAWNDFLSGRRTEANGMEWDELEIFCDLTIAEAVDLMGLTGRSRWKETHP